MTKVSTKKFSAEIVTSVGVIVIAKYNSIVMKIRRSGMSDFSRWFKDNRIYELGLYDGCKEAWDHKEKEIQELKEKLDKAVTGLKYYSDPYNFYVRESDIVCEVYEDGDSSEGIGNRADDILKEIGDE